MRFARLIPTLLILAVLVAPARAEDKKSDKTEKKAPAKKVTLAVFGIGSITESSVGGDFPFGNVGGQTLRSLTARLRKAATDDKIAGVVLLTDGASLGVSQIEELRQAMAEIRKAKKEIHVHATSLGMDSYTLASGGSEISVTPTGDVTIHGVYGERIYLRGLLDILGVSPDFLACGDYKAAAEMYTRHGPSQAATDNTNWLFDGLYDTYLGLIASGRGVDRKKVEEWIDEAMFSAEKAKAAGIIDHVQDRRSLVAALKKKYGDNLIFDKRYGKKKPLEIDLSSPFGLMKFYSDLLSAGAKSRKSTKDAIAIVHVEGPISTGSSGGISPFSLSTSGAFSTPIRKALHKAADDDSIKAVVLRVNSPGGSALASEIILRATKVVQAKKPLIVSMGDVAGSGGYYVAMGADAIFADKSTITGSIGVVGGKISTTSMFRRVGVNFHATKRGKSAGIMFSGDPMSADERSRFLGHMHEIYDVFKGHVVAARGKKLKKQIDELAGGRVFTGKQALELGLVDKLGTLNDALAFAAGKAKIEKYEVRILPKPVNFLEALLGDAGKKDDNPGQLSLPAPRKSLTANADLLGAAIPHLEGLDPQRLAAITRALRQLATLQREGVSLNMPELYLRR